MAKDKMKMISELASEQPPKGKSSGASHANMPGKESGGKMPHEKFHDKIASKLGC